MVDEIESGNGDENDQPLKRIGLRVSLTILLIFFTLISCSFLLFVNNMHIYDRPPYLAIGRWLWFTRMILFVSSYSGAAYIIGRGIWTKVKWKKVIALGLFIFLFDAVFILGGSKIENPIHPINCCMNFDTYWGWVYPFLKCPASKFCGFQWAEWLTFSLVSNIIFFSSLAIVLMALSNKFVFWLRRKKLKTQAPN